MATNDSIPLFLSDPFEGAEQAGSLMRDEVVERSQRILNLLQMFR
jgi:hypothetical protein